MLPENMARLLAAMQESMPDSGSTKGPGPSNHNNHHHPLSFANINSLVHPSSPNGGSFLSSSRGETSPGNGHLSHFSQKQKSEFSTLHKYWALTYKLPSFHLLLSLVGKLMNSPLLFPNSFSLELNCIKVVGKLASCTMGSNKLNERGSKGRNPFWLVLIHLFFRLIYWGKIPLLLLI